MTDRQRREFLQLAVGGTLAASLPLPGSRRAAAEPLGKPVPFSADAVLKMAAQLASKPFKEPQAPLPSVFSGLTFEKYAAIRRVPGTAIWSDRQTRLFPRAAASRLRLHDSGRDQHCRKRHVAKGALRRGRFRLRRVEASRPSGRPWLFGLAHPQVVGSGLRGRRDLPGRDLLSRAGARPAFRPHRARPCDSDRRRSGRGISAVPRVLDRKAQPGGEHAHHSCAARFGERHRRVPLHAAPAGDHHHRHRDDVDRADGGRQTGIRGHGRGPSLQPARPSATR